MVNLTCISSSCSHPTLSPLPPRSPETPACATSVRSRFRLPGSGFAPVNFLFPQFEESGHQGVAAFRAAQLPEVILAEITFKSRQNEPATRTGVQLDRCCLNPVMLRASAVRFCVWCSAVRKCCCLQKRIFLICTNMSFTTKPNLST